MSDAKFFTRGKVAELRAELATRKDRGYVKKKVALKRIVANMTMSNNDMVALFSDVVACMGIPVIEIKKMCFLYLENYGRQKPELAVHALPHILADLEDANPLVRGLALRTLSYIHVREFVETSVKPTRALLSDSDPYVRKTAAFAVAKLLDHDKSFLDTAGDLVDKLNRLLGDANPTVVSSALAALADITERHHPGLKLVLDHSSASKIIGIMPDCSEWNQIYMLEALASFVPQSTSQALVLAERITPRLQHANAGVVLTAMRIIFYFMNYITPADCNTLAKKLSPPLVTLLSKGPEIQYLALRNAYIILQRRPDVLQNEIKVFFCKYTDPIYVKIAKLEILYMLATEDNIRQVLTELKEYASEIDVDFVRTSVKAIGKLTLKIESTASECIDVLMQLVATKVSYIVQEAIVVMKNIFRKYPNRYEAIIATLCENLDSLDEPEAKSAMIWVIGEYADRINNAPQLLDDFLYSFADEPVSVQLALLTATIKVYIHRPTKAAEFVPRVLTFATANTDNPDLRDRAYMYWRLLSSDSVAAKQIIMAPKPSIATTAAGADSIEPAVLEELCLGIGTLASVHGKPLRSIFPKLKPKKLELSPALQTRAADIGAMNIPMNVFTPSTNVANPMEDLLTF